MGGGGGCRSEDKQGSNELIAETGDGFLKNFDIGT